LVKSQGIERYGKARIPAFSEIQEDERK